MCGRFVLTANRSIIETTFEVTLQDEYTFSSYNIAPSQHIPVVHLKENKRVLSFMKWGVSSFLEYKDPCPRCHKCSL